MARFLLLALSLFSLAACSLTYKEEEPQVSHIPEIVFIEVSYLSYEDGKVAMRMESGLLEQYRDDNALYGRDISFTTYTKEGELSAQGSSQMISVNTPDKQYSLLGDVFIDSIQEDLVVRTQALQWDGNREQLTSGASDSIELVRGKRKWDASQREQGHQEGEAVSRIELAGTGFSASAVSRSFQFSGEVSGIIYTRKKQDSQQ